jgi:hypothetical protein
MTIEQIQQKIHENPIKLLQLTPTTWKVVSDATFLNGNEIVVLLENRDGNWFFTDGKETLKYMNELYELKSPDVKMCIANILKIYGFSITSGFLTAPIANLSTFMDKYFDMIMCIGQLANMFAFFDKP